jgi:hypothetical protein
VLSVGADDPSAAHQLDIITPPRPSLPTPLNAQASLRSQGHDTALWLKDPMLSLMRGRRTLSFSFAPSQGSAVSLSVTVGRQPLNKYNDALFC